MVIIYTFLFWNTDVVYHKQGEAMWISFSGSEECAVKVSVAGKYSPYKTVPQKLTLKL